MESNLFEKIKQLWQRLDRYNRERYVEMQERQLNEMESAFNLLIAGYLTGLPAPPSHIALETLPEILQDYDRLINDLQKAADPLGELFSVFDID